RRKLVNLALLSNTLFSKEPLIESYADRVCAQKVRMQGARRSAVAWTTAKPGNTAAGPFGPNPFGAGPLRAPGLRHSSFICNEQTSLLLPCQPRAKTRRDRV